MTKLASDVSRSLRKYADPQKGIFLSRFFKTGKGGYAEGDKFLGLTVPNTRKVSKEFIDLEIAEIEKLLTSSFHEERLVALLILILQFKKADEVRRKEIFDFYLAHTKYVNNWDLVDLSAGYIVGGYLSKRDRKVLFKLAESESLWERRIAMISTFAFIKNGESKDTIEIAKILLSDKHDLIHKAVGWMLREMGKNCGEKILESFLDANAKKMPRTMLRYAIEKLPENTRLYWLHLK